MHTQHDIVVYNTAHPRSRKYNQDIFLAADQLNTNPGSADTSGIRPIAQGSSADPRADSTPSSTAPTASREPTMTSTRFCSRATRARARLPRPATRASSSQVGLRPSRRRLRRSPRDSSRSRAVWRDVLRSPFSEPRFIAIAYAFEQATQHRVPPKSTPPLPSDFVSRPSARGRRRATSAVRVPRTSLFVPRHRRSPAVTTTGVGRVDSKYSSNARRVVEVSR